MSSKPVRRTKIQTSSFLLSQKIILCILSFQSAWTYSIKVAGLMPPVKKLKIAKSLLLLIIWLDLLKKILFCIFKSDFHLSNIQLTNIAKNISVKLAKYF